MNLMRESSHEKVFVKCLKVCKTPHEFSRSALSALFTHGKARKKPVHFSVFRSLSSCGSVREFGTLRGRGNSRPTSAAFDPGSVVPSQPHSRGVFPQYAPRRRQGRHTRFFSLWAEIKAHEHHCTGTLRMLNMADAGKKRKTKKSDLSWSCVCK